QARIKAAISGARAGFDSPRQVGNYLVDARVRKRHLGRIPRPELNRLVARSDVGPRRRESFGVAVTTEKHLVASDMGALDQDSSGATHRIEHDVLILGLG